MFGEMPSETLSKGHPPPQIPTGKVLAFSTE
jgi:hypothetical protein